MAASSGEAPVTQASKGEAVNTVEEEAIQVKATEEEAVEEDVQEKAGPEVLCVQSELPGIEDKVDNDTNDTSPEHSELPNSATVNESEHETTPPVVKRPRKKPKKSNSVNASPIAQRKLVQSPNPTTKVNYFYKHGFI